MSGSGFILFPASSADCESIVRMEFEACKDDPGFTVIYPTGATATVVDHYTRQMVYDLQHDATLSIVVAKHAATGDLASFATWHFFETWNQNDLDQEMLNDDFKLPNDANVSAGNKLIANGIRRRHEIMGTKPYAYLASVATSPSYRKQGAASLLLTHFTRLVDDRQLPAYVEGTPAALGVYRKFGFEQVDMLKLEVSPWKEGDFYNLCMIRPSSRNPKP